MYKYCVSCQYDSVNNYLRGLLIQKCVGTVNTSENIAL